MIRLATAADLPALVGLDVALTEEMAQLAPSMIQPLTESPLTVLHDYLSDAASDFFVAEVNQQVVGFALVVEATTQAAPEIVYHHFAYLVNLFVSPAFRRQGLAQGLLDATVAWQHQRQLDFLQLNVLTNNPAAVAFYEKNHFTATLQTMTRLGGRDNGHRQSD